MNLALLLTFSLTAGLPPDPWGLAAAPPAATLWGGHGHRLIATVAAERLPQEIPAFFREAVDQLAYLNPEPDRWRSRAESELDSGMDGAHAPEHYVNSERVPPGAWSARNRLAYADSLRAAGVDVAAAGLAPFRILELTQRVRIGFRQWRAADDERVRAWIEARIINDAGILGHYVADLSNPAHTTIHHNGWVGENPRGYATDNRFHSRFESVFVQAHMTLDHVRPLVPVPPRTVADLRPAIIDYVRQSHSLVETLYELDRRHRFGGDTTAPENHEFAAARLGAGAEMLRDLWWSAWATSE